MTTTTATIRSRTTIMIKDICYRSWLYMQTQSHLMTTLIVKKAVVRTILTITHPAHRPTTKT
jgi:hypothetical protein